MSRRGLIYFHKTDLEKKLIALIRAAVELALVRHGLKTIQTLSRKCLANPGDLVVHIAKDAADAVRGIGTCDPEPLPEWSVIFAVKPKGRPRKVTAAQIADIQRRINDGEKPMAVATDHGISESHARNLANLRSKESA